MGKLLVYLMPSTGHFSVGTTLIKFLYAKLGNEHEYVILSDKCYEAKLRSKCPFARVRLYKNPMLPDDFDPKKVENPWLEFMDSFAESLQEPLEKKLESQSEAFIQMAGWLKEQTTEMESIIAEEKPQFIFFDHLYSIPYFMNKPNIPWGFICSSNPLYIQYHEEKLPPFCSGLPSDPDHKPEWDAFRATYKKYIKPFQTYLNDWLSDSGCEKLPDGHFVIGSPYVNLYLFPKEIDYYEVKNDKRLKGNWLSVDSCILPDEILAKIGEESPKLDLDLTSFLNKDPKRRLIYFSLGTLASTQLKLMQRIIDMLGTIEHNFIVSKGARGDQLKMPTNCLGTNFLNQLDVLKKVDVAISHGGNNTNTECFHESVPQIVLPFFSDQPDNARRVDELGLGKHLDLFTCTRDELAEAIDHLLFDLTVRKRIKEIGCRIQQDNGWEEVSKQLLPYLKRHHI